MKTIKRDTYETQIEMALTLRGTGQCAVESPVGFLSHMLELLGFHGQMDIRLRADGDVHVCDHHLVEDVGICLGKLIAEELGDKRGIRRYGSFRMPMDEALVTCDLDLSGRPFLVFNVDFKRTLIGNFSTEMVEEFFRAVAFQAGITLHFNCLYGKNDHHKVEAVFKSFGRALKEAVIKEGDAIPSSKGKLE
ncbi:MAG: imidazoleglycerol-phosphate dehydratase HisB [Eubacteriales bacterium]|nr:imidazoleglycerol-phosphate dehydratase HisB [Eubacteriales bacterium]